MAKAKTNTRGKRRVKKNIAKGVAHVHSTLNFSTSFLIFPSSSSVKSLTLVSSLIPVASQIFLAVVAPIP